MRQHYLVIQALIILLGFNAATHAQTISSLIDQVDTASLDLMLNEFAGEVTTQVQGKTVTILNRVSSSDNDLAADYLEEKLNSFGNLEVSSDRYNPGAKGGRNIIATQKGKTNPENIYIICGHYDAVANYCADDNASGTAAILEVARILSKYRTDNTVIYAFWDEEEDGLVGSRDWAGRAVNEGKKILGVINLDMIAFDKGGNDIIPIHTNNNSISLKDDALDILRAHSRAIGLTPQVVNPGIPASDHASFWARNFTSIMISEADQFGDLTPHYHTSNDRVNTLHLPYFHKVSKYLMAIAATKAGLSSDENNTGNDNKVLDVRENVSSVISLYPNPVTSLLHIKLNGSLSHPSSLQLTNNKGQILYSQIITSNDVVIPTSGLPDGLFYLKIEDDKISISRKIVKEQN